MRRMGSVTAPGIAQATYDAAVAKLVDVSAWVDLTATITTACAGAATADPDSLAGGLTVTTTTGTFDGATIPCNAFAWTTHTTTNDGYSETLNYDLGTIASLLSGYNPTTHGIQIEACLVAVGTLNSAQPIIAVAVAPGGSLASGGAGGSVSVGACLLSATSVARVVAWETTSNTIGSTRDPTGQVCRFNTRILPLAGGTDVTWYMVGQSWPGSAIAQYTVGIGTTTHNTSDKLILLLGQRTTTQGAVSGAKIRFRARLVTWANLDFTDLDLGCQA